VFAAALLAGACSLPESGDRRESESSHPNVILISIDTLRADRLNLHGYEQNPTSPVIDALARDGVAHEAHIASSPWTIPSHLSLLTSLHPSSHGVLESTYSWVLTGDQESARYVRLSDDRVTLAEALAEAGYRTGAFTGGITLDPRIGFDQGFELYDTSMYKLGSAQMGPMLEWLGKEPGRPFFLFWHTFEVHAPYLRGRFLSPSRSGLQVDLARLTRMIPTDPSASFHESTERVMAELLKRHDARTLETCSELYDGGIAAADFWIGRLLELLLDRDLYDDTLIVVTSDHGEELGDHDPEAFYDKHGHSNYEEVLRVPLVVKLPGSAHAGTRLQAVTSGVDVMPTVLEVAGVPGPADQMQGESLVGLWKGANGEGRLAFAEAAAYLSEIKSVRSSRHKLILDIAPGTVEERGRAFVPESPERRRLFDLAADPAEKRDLLAGDPAGEAERLASALEARLRAFVASAPGQVEEIELDREAVERLRAMGYVR
jgi:arylsulfatase A-like enzyme